MEKLIAEFSVRLSSFVLLSGPQDAVYKSRAEIDGFDVEVVLTPFLDGVKGKRREDEFYTYGAIEAKVVVAKDETTSPPPPKQKDGKANFSAQYEYFSNRQDKYQEVALRAINRVVRFFKFRMKIPLLHYVEPFSQESLHNPRWLDESGHEITSSIRTSISEPIPGISYQSNRITPLLFSQVSVLDSALDQPIIPDLYEEILSDAQDAIYQENFRRAVLEMAIATEVFVKQVYFGKDTLAVSVMDYWADTGRLNIRIIELIDKIAKRSFGSSFKDLYPDEYKDIDHLFRCRNKAVHHGKLEFSDDGAVIHQIDWLLLNKWLDAICVLFDWLSSESKKM